MKIKNYKLHLKGEEDCLRKNLDGFGYKHYKKWPLSLAINKNIEKFNPDFLNMKRGKKSISKAWKRLLMIFLVSI